MSKYGDPAQWSVTLDDDGVTCVPAWGTSATIAWDDLRSVEIQTNQSGPLGLDVWWLLHGLDLTLSVPAGARGEEDLLERLQALPDFDNLAVIDAMASVEEARWLLWRRSG